jgi:endonuclease III
MMNIDKVYKALGERFQTYKSPVVDLVEAQTNDPFKVLVATILSARTKDETTTETVNILFQKVNTLDDLDKISESDLDKMIFKVGFHNTKAKHLKQLPAVMREKFDGKVPDEIDDLVQLPGVGRKTANLVRVIAFRKPGICVDVHVHRISNRLGYVKTKTPFETEMALRKKLPEKYWLCINSYMVAFGQNHCTPLNPHCDTCPIYDECKRVGVKTKFQKLNS